MSPVTSISMDFEEHTQPLPWDRGRLARHEHRKVRAVSHGVQLNRCSLRSVRAGTPAVPVKGGRVNAPHVATDNLSGLFTTT
jgi:hypothetical protein